METYERELARAPISLERFAAAEHTHLGDLLEYRSDEQIGPVTHEFDPQPLLWWCDEYRVLWWVDGLESVTATPTSHRGRGARAYERWTAGRRRSRVEYMIEFEPAGRTWYRLADAIRVDYRSDRQRARGKTYEYTHAIGDDGEDEDVQDDDEIVTVRAAAGAPVYRCGDDDEQDGAMYILLGLTLTTRGLVG